MIPVESITEKLLEQRFDLLNNKLKAALTSDGNHQIVSQICKNHHISDEEKILIVEQTVAFVILGFVHAYDLNREIGEALGLNNPELTNSLTEEIKAKIFNPIKDELDAAYVPLPVTPPSTEKKPEAPKPLGDVKPPPSTGESAAPRLPSSPPSAGPSIPKPPSSPTPPSPSSPSQAPGPMTDFPKSAPPTQSSFGNFGSAQTIKPAPPMRPTPSSEPAPTILQEETEFKPLRQPSGFGINVPMQKSLDAKPEKEKIPMKPAMLEFGSMKSPQAGPPNGTKSFDATQDKSPRVVHYSELRTPLDSSADSGEVKTATVNPPRPASTQDRDIREITATSSSAPPPPASFGSTAREMPKPIVPPPIAPPDSMPKPPMTPAPKMSDVLLNEKELPPPSPPTNTERNRPIPPKV